MIVFNFVFFLPFSILFYKNTFLINSDKLLTLQSYVKSKKMFTMHLP